MFYECNMSLFWSLCLCSFFLIGNIHGVSSRINKDESAHNSTAVDYPTEPGVQYYDPDPPPPPPGTHSIVGGNIADAHSWPWQVMLLRNGYFQCGGTLINRRHVLTAAHCFRRSDTESDITVKVGFHDRKQLVHPDQIIEISKLWIHEKYDTETFENDIALLRLTRPVAISEKVNIICLPGSEAKETNEKVWVSGWGDTKENGTTSRFLKEAYLYLKPDICTRFYKGSKYTEEKQMCAGKDDGSHDTCQGDSGGPLMYRENNVWYLNGVVSYGAGCGRKKTPGVYARVSYYLPWINQKMRLRLSK